MTKKWLLKPKPEHVVQFYAREVDLINSLSEYVRAGLVMSEPCIIIATPSHVCALENQLNRRGVDTLAARNSGRLIMLDAAETAAKFMVDGLPDWQKFLKTVTPLVEKAAGIGKPVRAYGEMVALLWQQGNKEAMIQLENMWNKFAELQTFSLYCAYPELHFILDNNVIDEIHQCHAEAVIA